MEILRAKQSKIVNYEENPEEPVRLVCRHPELISYRVHKE
jgi:hypothetical protein